jgi:hypothetical protein
VNNLPLLVLAEAGIIGLVVVAVPTVLAGRSAWRALGDGRHDTQWRLAALTTGVIASGVPLLFFSQYNLPHLWLLPGLWLAALAEARSPTIPEASP